MRNYLVTLAFLFTGIAHATIIPVGVQNDYSKAKTLSDEWSIVYQGGYGTPFDFNSIISGLNSNVSVALAGATSDGAINFDVFSATTAGILNTITAANATIFDNGAFWYHNNLSLGFSNISKIRQSQADTFDRTSRGVLSWHTISGDNNTARVGGWRSGSNTSLNTNNRFQRYVLIGTVTIVPEPTTLALLCLGLAAFGFFRKKKTAPLKITGR
jgi:hypothetical protein